MNREQHAHGARLAQEEERQARGTRDEEQREKAHVHAVLGLVGELRVAPRPDPQQSRGPDQQSHASANSEQHRQAMERIWRLPPEDVMVDGSHRGRAEAQHEAVEGEVVEGAPRVRGPRIGIGAALAPAIQVPQAERVSRGAGEPGRLHELEGLLPHVGPEARESHGKCEDREGEHRAEHTDHDSVRQHRVERALRIGPCGEEALRARVPGGEEEHECKRRGGGEACHQAVAVEGAGEEAGPSVLLVRFLAHLREYPGEVELELVRRRVLARIQA